MRHYQFHAPGVASDGIHRSQSSELISGAPHRQAGTGTLQHVLRHNEQLQHRLHEAEAEIAELKRQLRQCREENAELSERLGANQQRDREVDVCSSTRVEKDEALIADRLSQSVSSLSQMLTSDTFSGAGCKGSCGEIPSEDLQPGSSSREPFHEEPTMLQERSDSVQQLEQDIHEQIAMHRSALLSDEEPRALTARGPRRSNPLIDDFACIPATARGDGSSTKPTPLLTPRRSIAAPANRSRCPQGPVAERTLLTSANTDDSFSNNFTPKEHEGDRDSRPSFASALDDRPLNCSMGNVSSSGVALSFFDEDDSYARRARQQRLSRQMELNRKKQEQQVQSRKVNRPDAFLGARSDDGVRTRPGEESGVPHQTPRTHGGNIAAGVSPRRSPRNLPRSVSPAVGSTSASIQLKSSRMQHSTQHPSWPHPDASRPHSPSPAQAQFPHQQLRQIKRPQSPGSLQQQNQTSPLGRSRIIATPCTARGTTAASTAAPSTAATSTAVGTAAADRRLQGSRSDQQLFQSQAGEPTPRSLHDRFATLRDQLKRQRGSVIAEAVAAADQRVAATAPSEISQHPSLSELRAARKEQPPQVSNTASRLRPLAAS
eukprot:TRINITY_DN23373_c0_g1_i1.p1 TRINITY_DN23373_c0_g1~~TRINITY_DN23373_c0_g1_i1.p1  ORF type:complete len:603 (+),score=57.43 TRINITY_DN23373_c0_g1_i1:120-1928(+)